MDSHHRFTEKSQEDAAPEEQTNQLAVPAAAAAPAPALPLHFATASLSHSAAVQRATHFFQQRKTPSLLAGPRPAQASYLTAHLSLSASTVSPPNISFKSTIFANPLDPRRLLLTLGLDTPGAAGLRGASIVWFRSDLRVHDNECLNAAHKESKSVLPVYCFDPRDYDKAAPYRASFLLESVSDLRHSLRDSGSDLVVRVGRPEEVLAEMAKAVGAEAVYAHREVSRDEVKSEERIEAAMKEEGVEVKYFWGSTLFHVDDLPFKVEDMPTNYGGFRERVQGLEVRKTMAALDQLKGLPKRGDVEPGDMPSLTDLGVNPSASMAQDDKAPSMVGGETEALQWLKIFAAKCQAQPNKGTNDDNIHGTNFASTISLWLTNGCISPRAMFEELKKTAPNAISAASKNDDGGSSSTGFSWLTCELLWRDFFRFITKKYSSPVKQGAPACAGALV